MVNSETERQQIMDELNSIKDRIILRDAVLAIQLIARDPKLTEGIKKIPQVVINNKLYITHLDIVNCVDLNMPAVSFLIDEQNFPGLK